MISIYTRSNRITTLEFWKWKVKRTLKKYSGPDAVMDSLIRGLTELDIEYEVNPRKPGQTVVIISGVVALQDAIRAKQSGVINTLIAGPCIVTSPLEHNRLLMSPEIDRVVVPSDWVLNFYAHQIPEISEKIRVWPAGVSTSEPSSKSGPVIIYDKNFSPEALNDASVTVSSLSLESKIFTYGTFKKEEYLKALQSAPLMIYLSRSESQGIALQEAWARNVPTLLPYSGTWKSWGFEWKDDMINAPYLTNTTGSFYKNKEELAQLIQTATGGSSPFVPKTYCDAHLSDLASARILIQLIHEANT